MALKRKALVRTIDPAVKKRRKNGEGAEIAKQATELSETCDRIRELLKGCKSNKNPVVERWHDISALLQEFMKLNIQGRLHASRQSGVEDVVTQWLETRYEETKAMLLEQVQRGAQAPSVRALGLFMELFRAEVGSHHSHYSKLSWTKGLFPSIIQALLKRGPALQMHRHFSGTYLQRYRDLRHFFFGAARHAVTRESEKIDSETASQLVDLLVVANLTAEIEIDAPLFVEAPQPELVAAVDAGTSFKDAAKLWTVIMGAGMSRKLQKKILQALPHHVVPWCPRKEELMDFLTDSFDAGGSTSLLALSGLLDLIQEKGLDYPQLYPKLYSQLDRSVLHSKHRSRFLRLLEKALSSTHLPAALIASFIKRSARLCLFAPPAAIVAIVPWLYKLLKSHQSCRFLIHRTSSASPASNGSELENADPFDMDVKDPMTTGAIDSSLWEIETLQSHYHPNVSSIASIISQQFLKQSYNSEDFLDHTYGTVSRTSPFLECTITYRIADDGE